MADLQPGAIGASEMIITPEGKIYHLNLHPDQLAPTIITVGDPGRVAEVSKYFDAIEHKEAHREFITHTGRIGSKRITVLSTGIGPDNIDITLNELDALANIDFTTRLIKSKKTQLQIVRMGTSGSLNQNISVDSMVVSSFGLGLDNLLHYYQHELNPEESFILQEFNEHTALGKSKIQPYIAEGSITLRNVFARPEYVHGITVTAPGFYAPQGRVLRGGLSHPNLIDTLTTFSSRGHRITNFEMETSAIYGLGKIFGHQCLSINTIVANRMLKQFSSNAAKAIDHMIQHSLEILAAQ